MRKAISILLISCSSCAQSGYIYYKHNIKKCIHNLEQVESWIHYDIEDGKINPEIAEDYMIAITHTKISLMEKYKKHDK